MRVGYFPHLLPFFRKREEPFKDVNIDVDRNDEVLESEGTCLCRKSANFRPSRSDRQSSSDRQSFNSHSHSHSILILKNFSIIDNLSELSITSQCCFQLSQLFPLFLKQFIIRFVSMISTVPHVPQSLISPPDVIPLHFQFSFFNSQLYIFTTLLLFFTFQSILLAMLISS
jgi:hypothetical protein